MESPDELSAGTPYPLFDGIVHTPGENYIVTIQIDSNLAVSYFRKDTDSAVEFASNLIPNPLTYPTENGDKATVFRDSEANTVSVLMSSGKGNMLCGLSADDRPICGTYDTEVPSAVLSIGVQCFRDFLPNEKNEKRDREVLGPFIGGRYRFDSSLGYGNVVRGYRGGPDNPDGDLYEFILSTGLYFDPQERAYFQVGADLDSSLGTVSCEIVVNDGAGYNVAVRRASVRVLLKPVVSIEGRKFYFDPAGEPVALVNYGERTYEFENAVLRDPADSKILRSDDIVNKPITWGNLGKDIVTGFLAGFGACVGASVLNKAFDAVGGVLNEGVKAVTGIDFKRALSGGEQPVTDKKLLNKECALDVAVSDIAMGIINSTAADYIAWAHEGFEGKPFFVQNPTTFYKNVRDEAIGRAIDRSGLGFLCDVKFDGGGGFDPGLNAKIRLELQNKYSQVRIQPPRCTYAALTNNLDEYFSNVEKFAFDEHGSLNIPDVDSFVEDFTSTLLSAPPVIDLGPSGHIVDLTPTKSRAGDKHAALVKNLEDNFSRIQNADNLLLSLARVDAAVDQARREVDSVASPPGQIFNPNNPTSLSAFQKCSDEENPEDAEDCYVIKADASFISNQFDTAIKAPFERVQNADEWKEIQ